MERNTSLETNLSTSAALLTEPVDVLVLSNKNALLPNFVKLLSEHNLTYTQFRFDQFHDIQQSLDLVGTAIIDAAGISVGRQRALEPFLAQLHAAGIATTLLNLWVEVDHTKFPLASKLAFPKLEELFGRVQANVSYRKFNRNGVHAQPDSHSHDNVEAMTDQLKMAGQVQRDFLPFNLPRTASFRWATIYKPAEWVSGDIYDITRLDEHHIGFYIADAVGHSIPAALLTMFINQAIVMRETKGNSYKIFQPFEVISNLNKRMSRQKLSGCQFATCCYCLLNTDNLQLTFCRAGHPYPILVHEGGNTEQLQTRGPLLGVFEDAKYYQQTIQLRACDKLFLYSDGAEPFIGKVDNSTADFHYTAEFEAIKNKMMQEGFDYIEAAIADKKLTPAEFDDVTILGLEITQIAPEK